MIAAGRGTRLAPLTNSISKHLFPIYDKPMIYYSLSLLLLAKIKDISLVTTSRDLHLYKSLLGDGSKFGIKIKYIIQDEAKGIAHALLLNLKFINDDPVCVVLGDNIIYGNTLGGILSNIAKDINKASIFGYYVKNPNKFGIIKLDKNKKPISIEEKPIKPKSNWAVPGIYFYDSTLSTKLNTIKPSKRNELEITDINSLYLKENKLNIHLLGRGYAWLDMGSYDAIDEASNFISAIEKRQGFKIGCIEEICFRNSWIGEKEMKLFIKKYINTEYGSYLKKILKQNDKKKKNFIFYK